MIHLLLIAAGGAIGAVIRHLVSLLAHSAWGPHFPWGTLIVNVAGSFLIGLLVGFGIHRTRETIYLAVGVGMLGSLTTYSTFSSETVLLATGGKLGWAALNVALNVASCLTAAGLGVFIGNTIQGGIRTES